LAVLYVNNIASEHSEPQSDIANSSKPLLQGLKFEESMFQKSELPKPNQTKPTERYTKHDYHQSLGLIEK